MKSRTQTIRGFLTVNGWSSAQITHLAGDASNRRYERLNLNGEKAILMDADPATGEQTGPFLHIADYLFEMGFSPPKILARDTKNGLLLLEDLGDALFARLAKDDPALELPLYSAAAEMLNALHKCPPAKGLIAATPQKLSTMIDLVFEPYARAMGNPNPIDIQSKISSLIHEKLTQFAPNASVTILRDFHAENLLWLPDRQGIQRVGLLDFQDALIGHPAYDLVSLLQDARRDLQPETEQHIITHFLDISGRNRAEFVAAYAIMGVQRNLRILGVFTRLCETAGKPAYIDLIPRVWRHLQTGLAHPELQDIATLIHDHIPTPTTERLLSLKEQCKTNPVP